MKTQILSTVLIGAVAMPVASKQKQKSVRPNIVYVFADQWRASSVGYTGDTNIKTPAIDHLASEGLNFVNCVSVQPVSTPHRASLMTGRYPTSTGMFLNDLYLPSEELCIAEIFAEAGYNTGYIGKWHLDGHGRSTFIPPARRQGWEYWKTAECDHNNHRSHYYTGNSDVKLHWEGFDVFAQTADAQSYILDKSKNNKPFILMLSYGPPHPASPKAPEEYRAMYPMENIVVPGNVPVELHQKAKEELQNYYALASTIDKSIGDLLKTIEEAGIADNTIFIFTSDHGGMIYSHGFPRADKQVAWNESAHVPFLLRYPKMHGKQGRVVETPINTPDITATLIGLAGIKMPKTIEGENLSKLVKKDTEIKDRSSLFMSVAPFNGTGLAYRAIRTKRYTYTRYIDASRTLFDHVNDPLELNNLIGNAEFNAVAKKMEAKLKKQLTKINDDFRDPKTYIEQYGYELDSKNAIPFKGDFKVQSPRPITQK